MSESLNPQPEASPDYRIPIDGDRWRSHEVSPYIAVGEPNFIQAFDGRQLAVQEFGPEWGVPVIFFHGNPGSRIAPIPPQEYLEAVGIRGIAFDRAGSGRSDPNPDYSVLATADDTLAIADAYGLEQFGVYARSGGVIHAVATAALAGSRVTGLALMAGAGPMESVVAWGEGMTEENVRAFQKDEMALKAWVRERSAAILADRYSHVRSLSSDFGGDDWFAMQVPDIHWAVVVGMEEGVRQNGDGWIKDILALRRPLEFDLEKVVAPAAVWHGGEDHFSPLQHAKWYAEHLPHAELIVSRDSGHFGTQLYYRAALTFLRNKHIGEAAVRRIGELTDNYREEGRRKFKECFANAPRGSLLDPGGALARTLDDPQAFEEMLDNLSYILESEHFLAVRAVRDVLGSSATLIK